jgi:hypothetical protein
MKLTKISNSCHSVESEGVEVFFSYQTAIGLRNHNTGFTARVANTWGPTTGKHFGQCGIKNAPIFSTDALNAAITGNQRQPYGHADYAKS